MLHTTVRRVRAALLFALLSLAALTAVAVAQPPVAQPMPARQLTDNHFAALEHEYVTYVLQQYPVVATYLGGSAFDPHLEHIDGALRDYSPEALRDEEARLTDFRARFVALAPARLSARRRIDRSVALA